MDLQKYGMMQTWVDDNKSTHKKKEMSHLFLFYIYIYIYKHIAVMILVDMTNAVNKRGKE